MRDAFRDCTALIEAPDIPGNVTDMSGTFNGCTALIEAPDIPNSVTDMYNTFKGCTALTSVPVIPDSVTSMNMTFYNCTSLSGEITIDANPNEYYKCLTGTSITEILGNTNLKTELLATKNEI